VSDKVGSSSAGASDESYEHEHSKFAGTIGWTNDPATWPRVMNRNVGGYLIQIGPPTTTTEFSPENESDRTVLVSQIAKRHVMHVSTSPFRA